MSIKYKAIIAVDFDSTIAKVDHFPHITGLNYLAKETLTKWFKDNYYLIIYTCRDGEHLQQAKQFLDESGIPYNAINEQHPLLKEFFQNDTRKIAADIYIDDKNLDSLLDPEFPNFIKIDRKVFNVIHSAKFKSILNICQ